MSLNCHRIAYLLIGYALLVAAPARAGVLAGWDVVADPEGFGEGTLAGTAVQSGVSIISGGGTGVNLNGATLALDGDGTGSNSYRGNFVVSNWKIDETTNPSPYIEFQINSTAPLDLTTFELVARRQAVVTPTRIRLVAAAFSTDGSTFSSYALANATGLGNPGSTSLSGAFSGDAHRIWELDEYTNVTSFWVRVRGLPIDEAAYATLNPSSVLFIDDRGDFNTTTPMQEEANANNPIVTGNSTDGFDVVINGALAAGTPGDFNDDDYVDGTDFLIWQRGGSPNSLSADDLGDWKTHFGEGPMNEFAPVPEPTSFVLLSLAAFASFARRRRAR